MTPVRPHGYRHWIGQRLSAVLIVLPLVYVVFALLDPALHNPTTARQWAALPLSRLALSCLLIFGYLHGALGLQVILEDYISTPPLRQFLIRAAWAAGSLLALIGLGSLWSL